MPTVIRKKDKGGYAYSMPPHCLNGEALLIFGGWGTRNQPTQFMGEFVPFKIMRGNKYDMIQGVFGFVGKVRTLYVIENNARRQLLMLKKGQFAHVYGRAILKDIEVKYLDKQGNQRVKKTSKWEFVAYAFMHYYVPKQLDIRKREEMIAKAEERDETEVMDRAVEEQYQSVIDTLLNSTNKSAEEEFNYWGDTMYKEKK